jgi:hypothetical protein
VALPACATSNQNIKRIQNGQQWQQQHPSAPPGSGLLLGADVKPLLLLLLALELAGALLLPLLSLPGYPLEPLLLLLLLLLPGATLWLVCCCCWPLPRLAALPRP